MSLEENTTKIASWTALLLAIVKVTVWIISWSVAVFSSAVDSILDFFVSIFNYIAIKNAWEKPNSIFNYWKWKIEYLASFLEGLIISLSGFYILYESISKIIKKESISEIWIAIYVMFFSVFVTFFLVLYLNYVAKKTWNTVIKADSLHYKTDLISNLWILVSLFIIKFTNLYIIDWIIGILISFYIIWEAYKIIKEWFLKILDISLDSNLVDKIKNLIEKNEEIKSYHFLKTRSIWNKNFVQCHLVFKNINISLLDAHKISDKIECMIKNFESDKYWEIDFHLDPYDDKNEEKCVLK